MPVRPRADPPRRSKGGETPVAYLPRPREEWLAYVGRVWEAGGLDLFSANEDPMDEQERPLVAGFFCVEKAGGSLRGITDRRPQNAWEEQIPAPVLPHGSQLGLVVLNPDEDLAYWAEDLSNYFCKRPG